MRRHAAPPAPVATALLSSSGAPSLTHPTTLTPATTPDAGDNPLTSRLARHLITIYSDVHDTIIDFDADDNLRHAAEAIGRDYQAVTSLADLAVPSDPPRPSALIVLRWPRRATTTTSQDANSLLSACQHHLTADGTTIVAITVGHGGTTYSEHEQVVVPPPRPPACATCTTSC